MKVLLRHPGYGFLICTQGSIEMELMHLQGGVYTQLPIHFLHIAHICYNPDVKC
jgi:hypothetical protein